MLCDLERLVLPPDRERQAMCDKRSEIDKQIARYRRLKADISDPQMGEATTKLSADLE